MLIYKSQYVACGGPHPQEEPPRAAQSSCNTELDRLRGADTVCHTIGHTIGLSPQGVDAGLSHRGKVAPAQHER